MARILVVDDHLDVARAIARMLSDHETATETDPRRAVERVVGGELFDMVIVDYDMPCMTGRNVSDALLDAELARPPIVLIMSGSENIGSLFATGRGVLIKPVKGNELRDLVSAILHEDEALSYSYPKCPL
ncbi:MAG TPA: response regulator [Kofleriaceae bacterium]|jgi:CheY-like chemotaxis protein|nr:response regulator [Kofleriaceae bacterium]